MERNEGVVRVGANSGESLLREVASRGSVLAVVAHPDDESFGLGAVLAALAASGSDVRVLCLTRGEASTLGAGVDLAQVRRAELATAAQRLGAGGVELRDFPDGGLHEVDPAMLDAVVLDTLGAASTLVVFESGGVTGHPDHRAATAAAFRVAAVEGLHVLEWGVAPDVADALNSEFDAGFGGLTGDGVVDVEVDRGVQLAAIACHESQATDNPVLARRLELSGPVDRIRVHAPEG
ncbi:PIG-L deacetylase family protein [Prescottella soli]|uniref:PIG-L deacetylase family protein n=1 Tax=Prescottella soli TaxID=1543852 RepID=A0ABW9FV07_9NOCA